MANILKNVTISHEVTPVGTAHPIAPAQMEIHPKGQNDVNAEMELCLSRDDSIIDTEVRWQSGYTQGFSDGATQERLLLSEQTLTLTQLLLSLPQAIQDHRAQLISEIADIVLLLVSKFFIHQQQNKEAIVHQITQVIMQLNQKQRVKIAVHPHDLALIQQGDIDLDLQDHENIQFTADERLRLGGCIVTSDHGVFDAGIERQIDQLKQVLLKMKSQHE